MINKTELIRTDSTLTIKKVYGLRLKNRKGEFKNKIKIVAIQNNGEQYVISESANETTKRFVTLRGSMRRHYVEELDDMGQAIKTDEYEVYKQWGDHWTKGEYTNEFEFRFCTLHSRLDLAIKACQYSTFQYNTCEIELVTDKSEIK